MFSWQDYAQAKLPAGPARVVDRVFIGDIDDATNKETLQRLHIDTVFSFLSDDIDQKMISLYDSMEICHYYFKIEDKRLSNYTIF